jgi:hypothetical protein
MQKISTPLVATIFFGLVPTVSTPKPKSTVTMKFSTYALAAAVVASVANGFAGPQVTPRFALQVRAPTCEVAVCGCGTSWRFSGISSSNSTIDMFIHRLEGTCSYAT